MTSTNPGQPTVTNSTVHQLRFGATAGDGCPAWWPLHSHPHMAVRGDRRSCTTVLSRVACDAAGHVGTFEQKVFDPTGWLGAYLWSATNRERTGDPILFTGWLETIVQTMHRHIAERSRLGLAGWANPAEGRIPTLVVIDGLHLLPAAAHTHLIYLLRYGSLGGVHVVIGTCNDPGMPIDLTGQPVWGRAPFQVVASPTDIAGDGTGSVLCAVNPFRERRFVAVTTPPPW